MQRFIAKAKRRTINKLKSKKKLQFWQKYHFFKTKSNYNFPIYFKLYDFINIINLKNS